MIITIITALLLLIVGFILLVKGADFSVEGSASVAKKLKIPSLVIGMTIAGNEEQVYLFEFVLNKIIKSNEWK